MGVDSAPTILIVDDHPSFRATARMMLEAEGLDVVGEAADGKSAVAAYARLHPAIVLLDIQLPDCDGFAVARHLTAGNGGPAVVLISSRDSSDYGTAVSHCGARGFVPKGELSADRVLELVGEAAA